jgi:uncharacterized membrane protein
VTGERRTNWGLITAIAVVWGLVVAIVVAFIMVLNYYGTR